MRHQSHHDKFGSGTEKIRSVLASESLLAQPGLRASIGKGRTAYSLLRWPILSLLAPPR
jgi:hypothetical protein